MFRGGFMFLAGVYAGVYVCQNYEIPRVDEPQELWKKVTEFMESRRKTPPADK